MQVFPVSFLTRLLPKYYSEYGHDCVLGHPSHITRQNPEYDSVQSELIKASKDIHFTYIALLYDETCLHYYLAVVLIFKMSF
jgi:hypothetical protein